MSAKPKLPHSPEEWSAYRVRLDCHLAKGVLDGKTNPPENTSRSEYALYCIASAVEELAKLVAMTKK